MAGPYESAGKRRIRVAALAILAREGSAGLTMRAIAAEVGFSATAIYRHYTNRDALIVDLRKTVVTALKQSLARPVYGRDCNERVLELAMRYVDWGLQYPELFDFTAVAPEGVAAITSCGEEHPVDVARIALQHELNTCGGSPRADAETLTTAVLAIGIGIFALQRTGRIDARAKELHGLFDRAMRLLVQGRLPADD